MDGCLDDNDLQAFFRGRLSASRTTVIQEHVNQCSTCRHLVAEVARTTSENEQRMMDRAPTLPGVGVIDGIKGAFNKNTVTERVVIRDGKISRRPSTMMEAAVPSSSSQNRPGVVRRGLEAGSIIADRYRLERVLGEGGTGIVWEATHIVMRRRVAVKIHKSKDPQAIRRFFREARVTAALRHPHIVEVHDVFTVAETGTAAMVMEFLEGAPLSKWTRPAPSTTASASGARPKAGTLPVSVALPLRQTVRVLLPVVAALGAAHGVGVVHRDLKPENVFLVGQNPSLDDPNVKVLDFGLAKLTATEGDAMSTGQLTRSGFVLGTPHYMSPEQVSGDVEIDARTDVWSLGVVLYECLAGARPIEADNLSRLFRAVLENRIVPLGKRASGLPKPIATMTMRMLSRPVRDRPPLSEVYDLLATYV